MWSFQTDPGFQQELDWIDQFVRDEVEPLDHVLGSQWNIHDPEFQRLVRRCRSRFRNAACGPATWGLNWAARATASSNWP